MRSLAALLLIALGLSAARAEACGPDKLGTSRILEVGTEGGLRVGLKTYDKTLPLADHEVVLTFDDGPDAEFTPLVLKALADECVRATFFVIGRKVDALPELARRELAEGHTVAHHTYTHPQPTMRYMDAAAARADILKGMAAVEHAVYGGEFPPGGPADLSQLKLHTPFFRFPGFADTAYLLAATKRIRVGTGGVMLQHYSPFKVAEVFKVLENLAPGRVDLGIGKAPGGLPHATQALQYFHDKGRKPSFDAALEELNGFLTGTPREGHPLAKARAKPEVARLPERILLGASPESAALAARLDWGFCYAGHFNGDPVNIERSLGAYRPVSGRRPQLALFAVAAASRERAAELVGELKLFTLHLPGGQRVNLATFEAVQEFLREAGIAHGYRIEEKKPRVIADTPDRIHAEFDALAARFGVDEFIIDNPVPAFADRLASLELLGEAALAHAA